MKKPEPTPEKTNLRTAWKPGQSGNPKGRPKGSRNQFGEEFVTAMQEDFAQHGKKAIETVRADRPDVYLKVIAAIIPKEVNLRTGPLDEMSDDDIASALGTLRSLLSTGLVPAAGSGREEASRH